MYRWNLIEINLKRLLTLFLGDFLLYEHYNSIINQADLSKHTYTPSDILTSEIPDTINVHAAKHQFTANLELISEEIYLSLLDIYFKIGAYKNINDPLTLPKIELSDDDLIAIVHDIIASTQIIEYDQIYKRIKSKWHHYLNIQSGTIVEEVVKHQGISGLTLKDSFSKKSYINIFRTHTLTDIEVLFHETMHAIYYELLYRQKPVHYLLHELEGQLGSIYTYEYLANLGFQTESKALLQDYLDNLYTGTYLLVVNHALLATADNESFNISASEAMINEYLVGRKLKINKSELPKIISCNAYSSITYLLASLIALEIHSKDIDTPSKFLKLHQIETSPLNDIEAIMNLHDVDYRKNDFQTLRKINNSLKDK